MSLFVLETEPVTQAATSISSLAREVSSVASSVSGYDTSCEDDFDFASPAARIASNIEACSTKIQNTAELMNAVVDAHTSIQSSYLFDVEVQESRASVSSSSYTPKNSSAQALGSATPITSGGGGAIAGAAYRTARTNSEITPSLARSVIEGEWGTGAERIRKLTEAGFDPDEVQVAVNAQLSSIKTTTTKSTDDLASEVINGKWGYGAERRKRLVEAGYDYDTVQAMVNYKLGVASAPPTLTTDEIVGEVLDGKWGNGEERNQRLRDAGYDPNTIQDAITARLNGVAGSTNSEEAVPVSEEVAVSVHASPSPSPETTPAPTTQAQTTPVETPTQTPTESPAQTQAPTTGSIDTSVYRSNPNTGFTVTTNNQTYDLSSADIDFLYGIVAAESDKSYDDSLAVISVILNRCENDAWIYSHGTNPVSQCKAPNQFEVYRSGAYKKYTNGQAPAEVVKAVDDALAGVRNNSYLSFRSNGSTGYSSNMITTTGNRYK